MTPTTTVDLANPTTLESPPSQVFEFKLDIVKSSPGMETIRIQNSTITVTSAQGTKLSNFAHSDSEAYGITGSSTKYEGSGPTTRSTFLCDSDGDNKPDAFTLVYTNDGASATLKKTSDADYISYAIKPTVYSTGSSKSPTTNGSTEKKVDEALYAKHRAADLNQKCGKKDRSGSVSYAAQGTEVMKHVIENDRWKWGEQHSIYNEQGELVETYFKAWDWY